MLAPLEPITLESRTVFADGIRLCWIAANRGHWIQHLWRIPFAIGALRQPRALILIKTLANITPIFWRRFHLTNFVNNGSKISETRDRFAWLPIQPRDILSRAPQQKCVFNVFNRNVISKERPGKLFIRRRKSEANAPAGLQECPNAFYVVVSTLGVFHLGGYHIRPECIADLHHAVSMLVSRESHRAHASLL